MNSKVNIVVSLITAGILIGAAYILSQSKADTKPLPNKPKSPEEITLQRPGV